MSLAYTPLTLKALCELDLPDPEWLVDGIIPLGTLALLSAREKAGKGLLTIDLCASIAAGEPFLDAAVMEGPAIYCATEEHLRDVRERVRARLGTTPAYPLLVLPLNGSTEDRLRIEEADDMERLAGMIEEYRPLLVVLDTLREIHDGAEDSSDEMTWRLRPIRQLAHQTNTTIVVNHHQSKAGGFRGSTAIRAACDLELAFTRPDDTLSDALRGVLRLEGRHGPRQTWSVHFHSDSARWGLAEAITMADTTLRGRILALLDEHDAWMNAQEMESSLNGPHLKTIQNELSRMVHEQPQPFAISGQASKGNPRRYRTLNPRLFDEEITIDSPHSQFPRQSGGGEPFDVTSNGSGNIPGTKLPLQVPSSSGGPRPGEIEA